MSHRRLLVIGNGSMARRHVRLSRQLLPDADIRVLRHRTDREISPYANGSMDVFEDIDQFEPEYVIVASPAPYHVGQVSKILKEGIKVLIEKPLSDSVEKASALLQFSEMPILIGYNLRFSPSLQYFKKLLMEGVVGSVLSVRCEVGQFLPSWRPSTPTSDSVSVSKALGGGVLLELSHEIDYLVWIFGGICTVNASLSRQTDLVKDVEDTAYLFMTSQTKLSEGPLCISLNMDLYRHDTTRFCVAIGETGSLKWDALRGTVEFFGQGSSKGYVMFSELVEPDETYVSQLKFFFGKEFTADHQFATVREGVETLKVIDSARLSSNHEGSCVRIERSFT